MTQDTKDEFEESLGVARKAAELARGRMTAEEPAPPASMSALLEVNQPKWRRVRELPPPVPAEDRLSRRLARIVAKIPPSFQWASFENPLLEKRALSAKAREATQRAQDEVRVVWLGRSGSGKTSLAAALFRAKAAHLATLGPSPWHAEFEPAWRLAGARARHPLGEGEPELVRGALRCGLLVLDDLGSDKPIVSSPLEEIVFERHWNALATWVTTWMTPDQMSARYGEGFARRVFDGAVVIDCGAI